MSEKILFLGFVLIFIGIFLILLYSFSSVDVKAGGIVMIGPIPIIFGNDRSLILISVILSLILMVMFLLNRVIR
ncbi:hypothetical protein DRN45_03775 [Thermococci archaeon]|nr:MAG: hypothetical protein DRN45_03775 [Thermococci archaeon]